MQKFEIRDHRDKEWFWIDREYLNGYARLLRPTTTLVYMALCRHANNNQESWPSIELLCEELRVSNKTIIKGIKELESWNIIKVSRSKDEETKRQNPNVYMLLHKKEWKEKPSVNSSHGSQAECNSRPKPSVIDDQKPSVPGTLEVNLQTRSKYKEVNTPSGRVNINPIFDVFKKTINPTLNYAHSSYRRAALDLVNKFGLEKSVKLAEYAVSVQNERYAPAISNPSQLKEKYPQLLKFYNSHKPNKSYEYNNS